MRAVAKSAEVSLGLVNYHYTDKASLVRAALTRIGEQDIALVQSDDHLDPERRLRAALQRIAGPEFLTTEYLALRLQLWSLASADPAYEQINSRAQEEYRKGLAALIRAARPGMSGAEAAKRAADINVVQNGLWLTALLGLDERSTRRSLRRCEEIAFAD